MRSLVALVAIGFLFSGCTGPTGEGHAGDDLPAESRCAAPAQFDVDLHSEEYQAAPDTPYEVEVEVPVCATNVHFEISTASAGNPKTGTISLTGCGSVTADWGGPQSLQVGNNNVDDGDLCKEAEAGRQTLKIETNTAALSGSVTVWMDLPSS